MIFCVWGLCCVHPLCYGSSMTNTDTLTPVPATPAPVVWEGMDVIPLDVPDEDWAWYMEAVYNGEM